MTEQFASSDDDEQSELKLATMTFALWNYTEVLHANGGFNMGSAQRYWEEYAEPLLPDTKSPEYRVLRRQGRLACAEIVDFLQFGDFSDVFNFIKEEQ